MLQVSFISSAICFHICVLHIHTACSYYPCSHPSLLHPVHSTPSPYPSHCMLMSDNWSFLLSHCMLVSRDVFCPILMPPELLQQSATSAGLAWSVTQSSLPHSTNNRFTAVCVDENNLYNIASHKSNPFSIPRGIVDLVITWEAVTVVEGITQWGLLWHRPVNRALVYPSQGGRYRAEGCMALG